MHSNSIVTAITNKVYLIILLSLFVISGCGGGGGDSSVLGSVLPNTNGTNTGTGGSSNTVLREMEPNNSTSNATTLLLSGGTYKGQLSSDTDIDCYKFTTINGIANFSIVPDSTATGQNGYIRVQILAADGTTILASTRINSSETRPANLGINSTAGTYYLVVDKFPNDTYSYPVFTKDYIIVGTTAATSNREVELNNTLVTATTLVVGGGSYRGQLYSDTDVDYYKFTTTTGVVNFSIVADQSVGLFSGFANYVRVRIFSSDGTTLLAGTNVNDSNTQPATLGINSSAGTYYIVVDKAPNDVYVYPIFTKDYIITAN